MRAPTFGLILVAAFAIGTGVNGLYAATTNLADAPNALATLTHIFNLLMGIAGIGTAVLIWRQHPRAMIPIAVWGASTIAASVLAPRAYAPETGWPTAIGGAFAVTVLVAAIVFYVRWRLGVTARGESSPAA